MSKLNELNILATAFGYPSFNVTGTQTGRVYHQCIKCQTKLPPGRNGRMCKECREQGHIKERNERLIDQS